MFIADEAQQLTAEAAPEIWEAEQFQHWLVHINARGFSCVDVEAFYSDIKADMANGESSLELYVAFNFHNIELTDMNTLETDLHDEFTAWLETAPGRPTGERRC